jgi:cobaltochelatase CobT
MECAMADEGESPIEYRVYTKDFDRAVFARDIDSALGRLTAAQNAALDEAWSLFQNGLGAWKTKVQLHALETGQTIRRSTTDDERNDTVVSILVDQSGSMRGQAMLLAAASVEIAQDFLRHLGCKVEVLGFTTVSWRGGHARKRWLWRLKRRRPGRLCELLHIIYRSADDGRASAGGWDFRAMLRPDLPKENVDGEALEWAAQRLRSRSERRKMLVVISDGVPADDATLAANGLDYLEQHLRAVISSIALADDIELGSVGIGFDVGRYYAHSLVVQTPDDLGGELIDFLGNMLRRSVASNR